MVFRVGGGEWGGWRFTPLKEGVKFNALPQGTFSTGPWQGGIKAMPPEEAFSTTPFLTLFGAYDKRKTLGR